MDKKTTLLLSGFFSIFIYISVVGAILYRYIDLQGEVKKYTFQKETIFEVSLDVQKEEIKKRPIPVVKEEKKVEVKEDKKDASQTPIVGTGIKSLFSEIEANAPVKNEEVDQSKHDEIAKRIKDIKPMQKEQKESQTDKIIQNLSTSATLAFAKTSGEYDEYYAKVQELLFEHWKPKSYDQNLESKILITIDSTGAFRFSVLEKSGDVVFDSELLSTLLELENLDFPPFDRGDKTNIEVIFKTEGN